MSSDGRGRHKAASSPETKRFLAFEAPWLEPGWQPEPVAAVETSSATEEVPPPARPPWLDPAEYEALLELRRKL